MEEYITMAEAARLAGYKNASTLQAAVRKGRLKAIARGPRARLTTQAWLDEYLQSTQPRGIHRGESKAAPE